MCQQRFVDKFVFLKKVCLCNPSEFDTNITGNFLTLRLFVVRSCPRLSCVGRRSGSG